MLHLAFRKAFGRVLFGDFQGLSCLLFCKLYTSSFFLGLGGNDRHDSFIIYVTTLHSTVSCVQLRSAPAPLPPSSPILAPGAARTGRGLFFPLASRCLFLFSTLTGFLAVLSPLGHTYRCINQFISAVCSVSRSVDAMSACHRNSQSPKRLKPHSIISQRHWSLLVTWPPVSYLFDTVKHDTSLLFPPL